MFMFKARTMKQYIWMFYRYNIEKYLSLFEPRDTKEYISTLPLPTHPYPCFKGNHLEVLLLQYNEIHLDGFLFSLKKIH